MDRRAESFFRRILRSYGIWVPAISQWFIKPCFIRKKNLKERPARVCSFNFVASVLRLSARTQKGLEAKLFSSHNAMVSPYTLSLSNRPWRFVTILWERWKYPIHRTSNRTNSEYLSIHYYLLTLPSFFCKMAKKTDKKKGRSAINEVVTREYTVNVHKRIHGMWVCFVWLKSG